MTDPNQILDRYLDGQLSPDEFEQLENELCRASDFADDFASAMLIDTFLKEKHD